MQTLKNLYIRGLIPYPRVENGYIEDKLFSYFPHPELPVINSFFEPLKENFYETSKHTALLYLHNKRLFPMSRVENTQHLIGEYFDKKSKSDLTINKLIDNYEEFMQKNSFESTNYFVDEQLRHYRFDKPKLRTIDYSSKDFIAHLKHLSRNEFTDNSFDMPINTLNKKGVII